MLIVSCCSGQDQHQPTRLVATHVALAIAQAAIGTLRMAPRGALWPCDKRSQLAVKELGLLSLFFRAFFVSA